MKIRILLGGSPCQFWSKAKKGEREVLPSGNGWELFRNYLSAKSKFAPDIFLYENNQTATPDIKNEIAGRLGIRDSKAVAMTPINSSLVSAQRRDRFYVTNMGKISQPLDRGIAIESVISQVVPNSEYASPLGTVGDKSYALKKQYGKNNVTNFIRPAFQATGVAERVFVPLEGQKVHLIENGELLHNGVLYPVKLDDGRYVVRKLTVDECCKLQTLPEGYCNVVSDTRGYAGLGNGWTAEVIIHLLNHALNDVPRDVEIVVLSMYDGIGTGRYCLDKMGFRNVKYYAYEIDRFAMAIANSNYPDIIQCGDAFQLRKHKWQLPE